MTARGHDAATLGFYAKEAEIYAEASDKQGPTKALTRFMAELPTGARILDLGCGTGRDTLAMCAAGFNVVPADGSAEMAAEVAKRGGPPVHVVLFENLEWVAEFDAVWANASLLHTPRSAITDVLRRINRALRPGGKLFASFKAGGKEGRDAFNRYYNYPNRAELTGWFQESGWAQIEIEEKTGGGYDSKPTDWLDVRALKETNA